MGHLQQASLTQYGGADLPRTCRDYGVLERLEQKGGRFARRVLLRVFLRCVGTSGLVPNHRRMVAFRPAQSARKGARFRIAQQNLQTFTFGAHHGLLQEPEFLFTSQRNGLLHIPVLFLLTDTLIGNKHFHVRMSFAE